MATDPSLIDFICEQAGLPGELSARKMFGEYALYLDGKVIALVCGNQLFVKPTAEGIACLAQVTEHPPYPGAKPHLRIDAEIEDRELIQRLFKATARALPLPLPKPKAAKAKAKAEK